MITLGKSIPSRGNSKCKGPWSKIGLESLQSIMLEEREEWERAYREKDQEWEKGLRVRQVWVCLTLR